MLCLTMYSIFGFDNHAMEAGSRQKFPLFGVVRKAQRRGGTGNFKTSGGRNKTKMKEELKDYV